MADVKTLLNEFIKVDGINAALVVGRDGFVIESATKGKLDMEAVGAVVSTGIGSSEVMGESLKLGEIAQAMMEYKDGLITTSLLGRNALLVVVSDARANIGAVRYHVKTKSPDILRSL